MASIIALFLLTLSFGLLWRILTKIVDRSLPPGPPRVPLLGHLHLLGVLPHKSLSDLSSRYGPVMLLWFGFAPTLVVSSPDAAREVLCTQDLAFALSKDLGWTSYGPYWRLMRKVTTVELFTAKRLEESRMGDCFPFLSWLGSLIRKMISAHSKLESRGGQKIQHLGDTLHSRNAAVGVPGLLQRIGICSGVFPMLSRLGGIDGMSIADDDRLGPLAVWLSRGKAAGLLHCW
ncbi:costunolide synthase-like [Selaginella moellendorffii]|uniref:costunolide synthase-like n=1 Tax=Selaginella moellendorffii TaxID=88036 RepID=UPI000D1C285B|nr:costunolide synthase-like [Selaginella moellendorffii]|eukprot:XP_024520301.1 costunolide synthase-like [Selaginella moellendorffii]